LREKEEEDWFEAEEVPRREKKNGGERAPFLLRLTSAGKGPSPNGREKRSETETGEKKLNTKYKRTKYVMAGGIT